MELLSLSATLLDGLGCTLSRTPAFHRPRDLPHALRQRPVWPLPRLCLHRRGSRRAGAHPHLGRRREGPARGAGGLRAVGKRAAARGNSSLGHARAAEQLSAAGRARGGGWEGSAAASLMRSTWGGGQGEIVICRGHATLQVRRGRSCEGRGRDQGAEAVYAAPRAKLTTGACR